jgi:hypothetical protein
LNQAADRILAVLGQHEIESLAAVPEHHHLGAEFHGDIHRLKGIFQGLGADGGIVAGHGAILENWIGEK